MAKYILLVLLVQSFNSTPNAYQEDNHGWVQAYLIIDGKEIRLFEHGFWKSAWKTCWGYHQPAIVYHGTVQINKQIPGECLFS
jgi:hypothetical protein